MARLLLVTNGPAGMRYSTVELGRRLRAAGHEVTLLSDPEVEATARHHDLGFRALATRAASEPAGNWFQRWRGRDDHRQAMIEASGARAFPAHLDAVAPDLVLLDGEMQEHVIVAAVSGVPLALMNTFCSIWRQAGTPPPHTDIRPGRGWRGSALGMSMAWRAFLARKRVREKTRWLEQAGADRVSVLKVLADEQGFDFRNDADASQWLVPRAYPAFPALSLHAREFEWVEETPDGVHFLGPLLLRERLDPPLDALNRERLAGLFEAHRRGCDGPPLVYAGFGSFFTTDIAWMNALFDAFRERPDWSLIVPVGDDPVLPPDLLDRLPANVHLFPWLPQFEVLRHCDLAVVHGGINTVDECVLARVPMLVLNGRETDMPGNQARVIHHGLGLAADADHDTPARILAALDTLRGEGHFLEALDRLARVYEAYEKDRVAERVIAGLIPSRGASDLT